MKKIFLSLLVFLTGGYMAQAQIPQAPKALPSPTAAGLGLYGEVPVSPFTGTPQVTVPLYEIHAGQFELPLALSYHASGVQPDQHPGWLGIGWSLNATGVITRVVNDAPDEYSNPLLGYSNMGYYYTHSLLSGTDWNTRDHIRTMAQDDVYVLRDTEPDIFSFNFMGYSGRFALNHNGQWEVQCDRPVKVEVTTAALAVPFSTVGTTFYGIGYSPSFGGFVLTTEDGTRYSFGNTAYAIEYSINFFNQHNAEWKATSWYLQKIEYTNGQVVDFTYVRGDFICQMHSSIYHNIGTTLVISGRELCSFFNGTSLDESYQGQLIAPVYLRKITTNRLVVEFTPQVTNELRYPQQIFDYQYQKWQRGQGSSSEPFNPVTNPSNTAFLIFLLNNSRENNYPGILDRLRWNKLASIRISDTSSSLRLLRLFNFGYNDTASERLMLKSVEEVGGRKYTFDYKNPDLLPPYLSNQLDHWGFYNGRTALLDSYAQYYSYREPVAACLQYGSLQKITYPTGGYTRFEFEPHDYRKQLPMERWNPCEQLSQNKTAGGLRIKRIIHSDTGEEADEEVEKEYYYVTDYLTHGADATTSSGVLGGQTQYFFPNYTVESYTSKARLWHSRFSSQSILPGCENSQGSHVGYSEVVEKRADGSFIRYRYSNFDNGYGDDAPDAVIQESHTPYEPCASNAAMRGLLLSQEEYSSGGVLKRKRTLEWQKPLKSPVRAVKIDYSCSCGAHCFDEGSAYRIYTYVPLLKRETETWYDDPLNPLITKTEYLYDSYGLVSREACYGSVDRITTYMRPGNSSSAVHRAMTEQHILSPVIEKVESVTASDALSASENTVYTYKQASVSSARQFILEKTERKTGTSPWQTLYTCHAYDSKGKPVYVTENERDAVYLWGYSNQYLVAVIRDATLEEVEAVIGSVQTFANAQEPDWEKVALLRERLTHSLVTSYTHQPGIGILSVTQPNGVTTSYTYDALGRLASEKNHQGETVRTYTYQYN